ncbi:MAG: hypothetical protein K8R59_17090 [Thermoanaerobaculales bacterium]|nr:hypothetical protein [Thermoanaerobaculales bacterium]
MSDGPDSRYDLALGPFLGQIAARLEELPHESIKNLLLAHARGLTRSERSAFHNMLLTDVPVATENIVIEPDGELLDDISSLRQNLSDGSYYDGWGWDDEIHDERSFGDESWVDEMDALFDRAAGEFWARNYELACTAYGRLLTIFDMSEDGGTFSGPRPPEEMVESDLDEAAARYLRCLYHTTKPKERVPALSDAVRKLALLYVARVSMKAVIDAEVDSLPGLARFFDEWKTALTTMETGRFSGSYIDNPLRRRLLREVFALDGGADGLAELARKDGSHHAEAYHDWVTALIDSGRNEEALAAAQEGAEKILQNRLKAKMCDRLAELASELGRTQVSVNARRKAWRIEPKQSRLQDLLGEAASDPAEIESRAIEEHEWGRESDIKLADNLAGLLEVLVGDFAAAQTRLLKAKVLGWSNTTHPGQVVFPCLLLAGSASTFIDNRTVIAQMFHKIDRPEDQWQSRQYALDEGDNKNQEIQPAELNSEILSRHALSALIMLLMNRQQVPETDRENLLKNAEKVARHRTKSIVSNTHRKAYGRAAEVLIAVAEAWHLADNKHRSKSLLSWARSQFPRHSAFKRELNSAEARSPLLSSKTS